MKKTLLAVAVFLMAGFACPAFSDESQFCAGFEEGYKSIKGDTVFVPLCPFHPLAPFGSTDFREGIKAGIAAALVR